MTTPIDHIIKENDIRKSALASAAYDPLTGNPRSPHRRPVVRDGARLWLPETMLTDPAYNSSLSRHDFDTLRFRHDFEFWAATCVSITDKHTGHIIPFRLNAPQRRFIEQVEQVRLNRAPIRFIMLKARQWGGSTVVQVYFAWIQIIHRRNWNSLICAHIKDIAAGIRGMYTRLLASYPPAFWEEEGKPEFRPYERMNSTRYIPGRDCKVTVCSSESQESARGLDCSLVHLSEVAYWKDSLLHRPEDLIRSVVSGVARKELSFVVMESTANGVGNFFHREWLRAVAGKSDKIPFFVPWFEIPIYSEPVDDPAALWASLDDYERGLWHNHGCTLEAIAWYHAKRMEAGEHRTMMAEFPSTPDEAFCATSVNVFASADVERMRRDGCHVACERGEVTGSPGGLPSDISSPRFTAVPDGGCTVWSRPREGASYIAAVDIGGRSRQSDWSVISVIDRHTGSGSSGGERPEVVAQWRGHLDHDLLAWKAAAMAAWYNDALLVVESNTWETASEGRGRYILDMLAENYANLYFRDDGSRDGQGRPGFHTNVATKAAVIANLIALVRDDGYIERSSEACDELLEYECNPDGSYSARRDCHDDILMTRAIALWVNASLPRAEPDGEFDCSCLARYY